MVQTKKDPVLAVLSLSGGNDGLNCVIPRNNGHYRDARPTLAVPEDQIIPITDELGLHPTMGPLKKYWDEGKLAVFVGIGYPTPSYSHFRSMDIWHTCEPEAIGTEGWLGRATKQMDPNSENVLTAVNFGRGLPRALVMDGVPAASVGNLETYGLLTGIEGENQRNEALDVFGRMYAPAIGTGAVMDYIHQTGTDALKGADILSTAPDSYSSTVEYSTTAIGQYMKNIAQTHLAGFGTRVLYTTSPYNGFDSHANQAQANAGLLTDVSNTVDTFMTDLREHDASEEVTLLLFSEFGRRVIDNGSGTDHGAAGVAFAVGEHVKGGVYGTYPSLEPSQLEEGGNLKFNLDFRSVYSTILEDWFQLDPEPIVNGNFERTKFFA
ncbi:MAG: DUF1501 domain-containing protein [Chloroflexota bacterium]|jgi:uncharacterized protein (DUF1501 family)|nr:MAG: DUF1501 domain-containing protein [SAR202 cluster bacterium]MEE3013432.1 DUF1501 domain-containing protein [Chloroflexota bacterium]GIS94551.1 MAG: hypothetical protein CM1200mP22_17880 [Dehalococcoidia bacterium]|tara:strand:+ start:1157 stop:2296 length:1140 start_codon:yes stop_codon:yes gene_type:complete